MHSLLSFTVRDSTLSTRITLINSRKIQILLPQKTTIKKQ
ncbi:protein of unknown function [Ectopseudomonas oleovorans]|nr:protein of unknown function [Pseudomonas oleovorans]